jgi:hypothetical protein
MKPSIVLLAALAGIGGWLYIQLSPYPANQRLHELKRLPGVESVVEWSEMRKVQAAFDNAEDGVISIVRRGHTTSWNSFDEWKADFEANGRDASFWYNKLMNEKAWAEMEQQAEEGSFSALYSLALRGTGTTADGTDVIEALRESSDTGAFLAGIVEKPSQRVSLMQSREGMLLGARMMQENMRWPGISDSEYEKQTRSHQRSLSVLHDKAETGDPDARWVMGQLHGDTPVRIRARD